MHVVTRTLVVTISFSLLAEFDHLCFVSLFYHSCATILTPAYQTWYTDTHKKEKDRHFTYPLHVLLDLLHGFHVGGHLEDTRWNTTHGYNPWCHKLKHNAESWTVKLLTSKSVPVHALISSGVSPSQSSIRVRPFVLSTSNTAWWKEAGQKERVGGKTKRMQCLERKRWGLVIKTEWFEWVLLLIDEFESFDLPWLGSRTGMWKPQLSKWP